MDVPEVLLFMDVPEVLSVVKISTLAGIMVAKTHSL